MDDKELIILAAKVAGIDHPGGEHSRYDDGRLWDCKGLRWWNPLADDGDALRLALNLRMGITHNDPRGQRRYVSVDASLFVAPIFESFTATEELDNEGDRPAATRRAIVRAAAGIARQESSHG